MSKVVAIVKMPAAPGKGKELAAAMDFALENVKAESGTRYYIIHAEAGNDDVLWMYEMYTDQDALTVHMGSEAFKALGPSIMPFLAGRPELIFVTPIGGKGA